MQDFIESLQARINNRRKASSRLYQIILAGEASLHLLQNFALHRIPIKSFWTRNILGIAARVPDYGLRTALVANIYEEETGALTKTARHLETFFQFGRVLGLAEDVLQNPPVLPETKALIDHNVTACNSDVHFTAGVASVLLLMEGQPPLVSREGNSMEAVMREVYGLPAEGCRFFALHASQNATDSISPLEDEHADVARELLRKYCTSSDLQQQAVSFLETAIELRHRHFDMISTFHSPGSRPFRWAEYNVSSLS